MSLATDLTTEVGHREASDLARFFPSVRFECPPTDPVRNDRLGDALHPTEVRGYFQRGR